MSRRKCDLTPLRSAVGSAKTRQNASFGKKGNLVTPPAEAHAKPEEEETSSFPNAGVLENPS